MSHSNHYSSFTIHYNGDYSGPYTINNSKRDESGEVIENQWNTETHISIKFDGDLIKLIREALYKSEKQILISGIDEDRKAESSFMVNTDEVLDFLIEKDRDEMISEIESMDNDEFYKKYFKSKIFAGFR